MGNNWKKILAVVATLVLGGTGTYVGTSQHSNPPAVHKSSSIKQCSNLPSEAKDTAHEIETGGPYKFPNNDNTRFGNYENRLPKEKSGYYREYTVVTPGSHDRGARRIIAGGGSDTKPAVRYYTDDHYETFCEIPDGWR